MIGFMYNNEIISVSDTLVGILSFDADDKQARAERLKWYEEK